ncbi:MAG: hypothetical protein ACI4LP_05890 [Anaerovoracaceae bacterium]
MRKVRVFITTAIIIVLSLTIFCGLAYAEDAVNEIQVNKEYRISELESTYMEDYNTSFTISSNGRIRVWIKDCNYDIYDEELFFRNLSSLREDRDFRKWKKSADQMNSGWITVTPGEWEVFLAVDGLYSGGASNEVLFIEFQREGQYIGETESNGTFSSANAIASGQIYEGNFSGKSDDVTSEDNDYYKLSLDEPGIISINLINTCNRNNNVPFELYRADENNNKKLIISETAKTREFGDKIKNSYNVRVPEGDYFIKVESNWKESAEYTLKADYHTESSDLYEQEFNNSSRTANLIKSKVKYTGNLNDDKDVDWYKVELENEGTINAELWIPENVGTESVQIELYNSSMKKLYSKTTTSNVYYASKKKTVSAGTYFVCIKSGSKGLDSTYDYKLRVNAIPIIKPVTELKAKLTGYDDFKITWKASKGAEGYVVYAKKGTKGSYIKKGFTEETEFLIGNLSDGVKYTFAVVPCLGNAEEYYECEYAINETYGYTLKKVVQNNVKKYSSSKVKVSWKDISGESGYQICKMIKENGEYLEVKQYKTTKNYINITAKKGEKYYYKVRAYKKIGDEIIYAPWSSIKSYKL